MPLNANTKQTGPASCEICQGKKNRNRQIYHILKFDELDELKSHLKSVFSEKHYCVDFYTNMFVTAHQIYGQRARDLYQPLWLVYLEAHGVEVKNRGDSIMKYRGQTRPTELIEETPLLEGPK